MLLVVISYTRKLNGEVVRALSKAWLIGANTALPGLIDKLHKPICMITPLSGAHHGSSHASPAASLSARAPEKLKALKQ